MKLWVKLILAVLFLSTLFPYEAHPNDTSKSRICGFVSAGVGNFTITFPDVGPAGQAVGEDVGWDDVYGKKAGVAFSGEVGMGLSDIGLFGIVKYRRWEKTGFPELFGAGSFDGTLTWTQHFYSIGGRYFFASQTNKTTPILPFLGAGICRSEATERMSGTLSIFGSGFDVDLISEMDGTGFYAEGGMDVYLSPSVSLRGLLEYTNLNLGISLSGTRYEIDGGGGFYAAGIVNFFFGKSLK